MLFRSRNMMVIKKKNVNPNTANIAVLSVNKCMKYPATSVPFIEAIVNAKKKDSPKLKSR